MKATTKKAKEIQEIDLPELIEKWKKEYGRVYQSKIADEKIIWRTLTRGEYKELVSTKFDENEDLDYYARQEAITEKIMLYPANKKALINDFAGVADFISAECMIKSGFGMNTTEEL